MEESTAGVENWLESKSNGYTEKREVECRHEKHHGGTKPLYTRLRLFYFFPFFFLTNQLINMHQISSRKKSFTISLLDSYTAEKQKGHTPYIRTQFT